MNGKAIAHGELLHLFFRISQLEMPGDVELRTNQVIVKIVLAPRGACEVLENLIEGGVFNPITLSSQFR